MPQISNKLNINLKNNWSHSSIRYMVDYSKESGHPWHLILRIVLGSCSDVDNLISVVSFKCMCNRDAHLKFGTIRGSRQAFPAPCCPLYITSERSIRYSCNTDISGYRQFDSHSVLYLFAILLSLVNYWAMAYAKPPFGFQTFPAQYFELAFFLRLNRFCSQYMYVHFFVRWGRY